MKRTARQQPRFSYGKMFREEFETPELLRRKLHDAREKLCRYEDFEDPEYRFVIGFR